ncbi:MAG: hypothetical protein LUJ09_03085, partial [Firmicutes bacterium]|nr:hypothetical protein [Bacillota bacterium]
MIEIIALAPGVTLHCCRDTRFRQGALSLQCVRPMCAEETAANALLPAVLLRGSRHYPDLRAITWQLDTLYGASISPLVRRIGDYQTTGFYCEFMEDRFAMDGDEIFRPMTEFLRELLLCPQMEDGGFRQEDTQSEKRNLISAIEAQRSDKRAYAAGELLKLLCQADSFGIPRLGEAEAVESLTHRSLYAHYETILRESPVTLFYVGSAEPARAAEMLGGLFAGIPRSPVA